MQFSSILIMFCICMIGTGSYFLGVETGTIQEREIRQIALDKVLASYEFHNIAKELAAEHTYSADYNCRNFSEALVERLEAEGYEANIVTGWMSTKKYCGVGNDEYLAGVPYSTVQNNSCLSAHAWVEVTVAIEATTGRIIKVTEQ